MRRDFIRISPDEDAAAVLQLMAMARVRALPVVEAGRTCGFVAHRDLARAALARAGAVGPVASFVRPVEPVSPEALLSEAARRMLGAELPCLVAAEGAEGEQHVVGLVTEGDLLRVAYRADPLRP